MHPGSFHYVCIDPLINSLQDCAIFIISSQQIILLLDMIAWYLEKPSYLKKIRRAIGKPDIDEKTARSRSHLLPRVAAEQVLGAPTVPCALGLPEVRLTLSRVRLRTGAPSLRPSAPGLL
jgi:hypothetical protein